VTGGEGAIFWPEVAERFEGVVIDGLDGLQRLLELDKRPGRRWRPPVAELVREDAGRRLERATAPYLNRSVLVLRDEAIEGLAGLLEPHGLLVPLTCADAELVAFVAPVLDLLDEESSELVRFDSGRVMDVLRPRFRDGADAHPAFRVSSMPAGPLFVSAGLAAGLADTGLLAGTDLVPVP